MNAASQTVAALLTPLGPGAIAVVGLRGLKATEIITLITRGGTLPEGVPLFRKIVDADTVLDDAILLRTQESNVSTVEIHTHGGIRIVQRLLMLLEKHGTRIVSGEEFVREGAAGSTIDSQAWRALLKVDSRRLSEWLLSQRELLPRFLAGKSYWSDADRAAYLLRSRAAVRLMNGLRIAIIGPPNAGKSTLANCLIGRDRVLTSDVPGTTRDWVADTAMIDGWPVTLVDTAGVRETDCPIEIEAIVRGTANARRADLVLIVVDANMSVDARRRITEQLTAELSENLPRIIVFNKSDLVSEVNRMDGNDAHDISAQTVKVSALCRMGMAELEQAICRTLGLDRLNENLPTGFQSDHLRV